jgi:hypothetical protein
MASMKQIPQNKAAQRYNEPNVYRDADRFLFQRRLLGHLRHHVLVWMPVSHLYRTLRTARLVPKGMF